MGTRTDTRYRGPSAGTRRGATRAVVIAVATLTVLSLALPAGAEDCTGDTTDTDLATTSCEGTTSLTTEDGTATVSSSTSIEAETTQGPVDTEASLAVAEDESLDTPSYTSPEREVTVPGTQTPELTVTTPRVDIREPIDLQAGGEMTVPSMRIDGRTVRTGGTHYGVPDAEVRADLFDPLGSDDAGTTQPTRRGAGSGYLVEDATGQPGSELGGVAGHGGTGLAETSGPDGHLGTSASLPAAVSTSTVSTSTPADPRDASGAVAGFARGGKLIADAATAALSATREAAGHGSSGPAAGDADVWPLAAGAILAIAGTGYLVAQRRSPVALS